MFDNKFGYSDSAGGLRIKSLILVDTSLFHFNGPLCSNGHTDTLLFSYTMRQINIVLRSGGLTTNSDWEFNKGREQDVRVANKKNKKERKMFMDKMIFGIEKVPNFSSGKQQWETQSHF